MISFINSKGENNNIALELYTTEGVLLKTIFKGAHKAGIHKEMIPTKEIASGVYFVKLSTLQTTQTQIFSVLK